MSRSSRMVIYILMAVTAVMIGSIAIIKSFGGGDASTQDHIDLGRVYLLEFSYEEAILEFTEAIEIEPLNPEGYLGLAKAYIGMGDNKKAVEVLENGYDKTGNERLLRLLDELLPQPEETTVTTEATTTTSITTEETTTVSNVAKVVVPDLLGLSEEEAIAVCEGGMFFYKVSYNYSDDVPEGIVTGQTVPAGVIVDKRVSLSFTVSRGNKPMETTDATIINTETTMSAPAEEFITIKGVQYSTSSTKLDLSYLWLTDDDIKDLNKMVNLTELKMCGHQISQISELSNLTNLSYLDLGYGCYQLSDISALSNLTNLSYLDLSLNQINDISALNNLTNLTELFLCNNQINDITALSNMTNLSYLDLGGNQISNISALSNLKNLTGLVLSDNQVSDISSLSNLTNLTGLSLKNNHIRDINALSNLTNLTVLVVSENQISDISALKGLVNLKRLDLIGCTIYDEEIEELKKSLLECEIWSSP